MAYWTGSKAVDVLEYGGEQEQKYAKDNSPLHFTNGIQQTNNYNERDTHTEREKKMGNVSTMSENFIKYLNAMHMEQKQAKFNRSCCANECKQQVQ